MNANELASVRQIRVGRRGAKEGSTGEEVKERKRGDGFYVIIMYKHWDTVSNWRKKVFVKFLNYAAGLEPSNKLRLPPSNNGVIFSLEVVCLQLFKKNNSLSKRISAS